jgi:PAS domain-containing protein
MRDSSSISTRYPTLYTWRSDGSLEYVNPRWADYVGVEQVTEQAVVAHLAPEDVDKLNALRQEALRRGEPLRAEFRLRDRLGRLQWFLTRVSTQTGN